MPRLGEVPKAQAHEQAQLLYQLLFGDRDPVAEPGTETGTPGRLVDGHRGSARLL